MGWFKRLLGDEELVVVESRVTPVMPMATKRAPRRDFSQVYPRNASIAVLKGKNPKRKGSVANEQWDIYQDDRTVGDVLDAGVTYRTIDGDVQRGNIAVLLPDCAG